ncbi:hypothetical protein V6N11_057156 [Hibiscus sabdariffa]|uniref:Uncharacterized protein n=2 Tax=Hibiscus sabdariffa TaxID=183260 RepID=A0ABR1ZYW8_9ROSI
MTTLLVANENYLGPEIQASNGDTIFVNVHNQVWRLVEGYSEKKQDISAPTKGRIRFHEEGGSSNSQSDFSTLGVGDPQGAPSALVTLVDAAPLCAVSETVPVSTPLAAANTATSLDEGEDNAVPEEEDCMFLRVFCLGMSMMFSFRGVSYAVAAPALDAIEE